MRAAYDVELLKLRRSRVVQVTTVALLVVPCLLSVAFLAAGRRGGADAMSLKAAALLPGDGWTGYLGGLTQVFATGGLLGMGVVVAWCFAREFTDRTVVSLYASATPREQVAAAKLAVLTGWAVLLSLALGPVALGIGLAAGLGVPTTAELGLLGRVVLLGVLTALLALVAALFASLGRGPLPAFGGLVGVIVAAQIAVVAGAGAWFPWSAAGLWAVAVTGSGLPPVALWQLLGIPLSAGLVGAATVAWWRRAELA